MWKPASVVPEHRKQASLVWGSLMLAAVGYTMWQITMVALDRRNPSTSLMLSNKLYNFPRVLVCLYDGFGCGYQDSSTDKCVASAIWYSYAEYSTDQHVLPSDSKYENCVSFDLTQFDVGEGERLAKTSATIDMTWISSDNASTETDYSASVDVFLGDDEDDEDDEEYTTVPYSRNVYPSEDESYETTAMTIGKTHRRYISRDPSTTYPVKTISTTSYVTTKNYFSTSASSFDSPVGYSSNANLSTGAVISEGQAMGTLHLVISQGSYSFTEVRDIDPLEIGTLLGNVGGFWELLVLVWGVCFIANSRDDAPTLKARNFSKALKRGTSKIVRKKRRRSSKASVPEHDEGRPNWDVYISSGSDTGGVEESGRFHGGHGRSMVSASSRRPVVSTLPRRHFVGRRKGGGSSGGGSMASGGSAARREDAALAIAEEGEAKVDSTAAAVRVNGGMEIVVTPRNVGGVACEPSNHSARSGFFPSPPPSPSSLESANEEAGAEEYAPEMEPPHEGYDAVCNGYHVNGNRVKSGVSLHDWGTGSSGDTMESNGTATTSSNSHWAMSGKSAMSSSSGVTPRNGYFGPTSGSFEDLQV